MAKKTKKMKFDVQETAGLTLGAVAAAKVSTIKLPVALPAPVQAALPLVLGVFLSSRTGLVGAIGKGMIAAGGVKLLGAVAPNLGINAAMETDNEMISDYVIEGADSYALAGATESVGATTYALAGVDTPDSSIFG
jgi:hypothetical protein